MTDAIITELPICPHYTNNQLERMGGCPDCDSDIDDEPAGYAFRVRDEWDNGEFMTGATVDLIEDGKVVHTETFVCSSEDAYGPDFSAYGNGRDNHAGTQARSYAWAWIESNTMTIDDLDNPTEW